MVKRFLCFFFILVILFVYLCAPAFAVDYFGWPIDVKGVGFYDSGVIHALVDDGVVSGDAVRRFAGDNAVFNPDYLLVYIPISVKYEYITVYISYLSENANFKYSDYGASWGYFEGGAFHATQALTISRYGMGTSVIEGNIYRYVNLAYKIDLPSDITPSTSTFICINSSCPANGYYLKHQVTSTFSGTYDTSSYSASLTDSTVRDWKWSSGSVVQGAPVYITGSYKSAYGGGTSGTQMDKIYSFLASTSGSGGYLSLGSGSVSNKLQFAPASGSEPKGSITRSSGSISGTLSPSTAKPSQSGTISEYDYYPILSFQATGVTSDSDLIEAVNNASDRNHTDITNFSDRNHSDLVNIGNNLQELVDHQDQVNQAGNDIGSTTSSSSISNTSGNLGSGVSGLNSTLSTASDVSSFVTSSTPYISFIGASLPVLLNFGDGVLAWAVVAIIAVTVFLYILKKVSE